VFVGRHGPPAYHALLDVEHRDAVDAVLEMVSSPDLDVDPVSAGDQGKLVD